MNNNGLNELALPSTDTLGPALQSWFDNNVSRSGGPVTRTELESYLLNYADANLPRSGGPLTDAERLQVARAVGMPLADVVPSDDSRVSAGVPPLLVVLVAIAGIYWMVES